MFWLAMVAPTVLWWHDSILWVAFLSIYALVATHWGAWQAARAEAVQRDRHTGQEERQNREIIARLERLDRAIGSLRRERRSPVARLVDVVLGDRP